MLEFLFTKKKGRKKGRKERKRKAFSSSVHGKVLELMTAHLVAVSAPGIQIAIYKYHFSLKEDEEP